MKHLFIDSNIWLSLYHFTNDDLTQFEKLKELIGTQITLWVPQQVYDEVLRNREAKISEAFKNFDIKQIQFPVFCQQYSEYSQFKKDFEDIVKRYKNWKKIIENDVRKQILSADRTIKMLFEATDLTECDSVVEKAYLRYRVGNPPGKDNRYGDAINWECLLKNVPDDEDLYLVSSDRDYRSAIFDDIFNPFLENEWKQKKKGNVHFYKTLVSFFRENAKDIELKTEKEKQELIDKLKHSRCFLDTHGVIALMKKYNGWTDAQVEDICTAAVRNSQVHWILADDDVYEFYTALLSDKKYSTMTECDVNRIIEELDSITQQKAMEGKENWEADVQDAMEEDSCVPW